MENAKHKPSYTNNRTSINKINKVVDHSTTATTIRKHQNPQKNSKTEILKSNKNISKNNSTQ